MKVLSKEQMKRALLFRKDLLGKLELEMAGLEMELESKELQRELLVRTIGELEEQYEPK